MYVCWSSINLREVNRFHDTTEAIFACLMFIVCVISPSAIWISWRFFLDFSVIFLDFLLDVHRLCNLSLSLRLLYPRRTERVDGVGWPVSVSPMYPTLYLSQFVNCISFSLSTVFLSFVQLYFSHLSTVFLSVYELHFFHLFNCISFTLSTVFLSVYDQHFFYLFNCISFSL